MNPSGWRPLSSRTNATIRSAALAERVRIERFNCSQIVSQVVSDPEGVSMSNQTKIDVIDYTHEDFIQSDKRYLETGHARSKEVIEVAERAS